MDPFPTRNKAFSLSTQEARHKAIVRDRDDKTDAISFAVHSTTPSPYSMQAAFIIQCTYCGKHVNDYKRCYQRIGYPAGTRGRDRSRSSRGRGPSSYGQG